VLTRMTLITGLTGAIVTSALTGCGSANEAGAREIVAAFYPIAYAAQEIAGPGYRITNITPVGAEPHDIELKPSTAARIAGARLVLYLGSGFQPAVERAIESTHARGVDLLAGQELATGVGENGKPALDPHVWLDPLRYARMAETIGAAMDSRPAARRLVARLHALDSSYRRGLAHCRRRTIVTSHAAFGYLSRRYGLAQVALQGVSPEAEPSPRALAKLIAAVRRSRATTVFFETLVSPKLAETVAREAKVRTAVLDPVEGLSGSDIDRGASYFTVMARNLAALRKALGCS
jgi:zinc transport system substrate-binding protein